MPARKKLAPSSTEVGHGCVDCAAYELSMQRKPCSGCKKWSEWTPSQKHLDRMALRKKIEREIANGGKEK